MKNSQPDLRIVALRRFALSITAFNILGHTILGFEQAWSYPLGALAVGYTTAFFMEWLAAYIYRYKPQYLGNGFTGVINFLLPTHIGSLAIAMLLYPGGRIEPILFAVVVCVTSKYLFRVPVGKRSQHFFNPSNFGIAVTLLAFPWVGISPPYHFTENLSGFADWIIPLFITASGLLLNVKLTRKHPLIVAWLGGFILQAVVRKLLFGGSFVAMLLPMTGVAFLLFTFYMITDPGTTPFKPSGQVGFGLAVAATYGLLVSMHIVFGLFFALVLVSGLRGIGLYVQHLTTQQEARATAPTRQPSFPLVEPTVASEPSRSVTG